ncbi:hypothetical protein TUM20985_24200 [Mycobacterium antarcticum]|nr:hypothetical protein TUM20985_24200 [Mycolicibacterium sp. TUM20985]GLP75175.1 hypothetical protein TUM20983_22850 [Mycolicibacterium sp. TUM20983]GLP80947.1 hypothetical protein TUM20984_23670 [Mycolicibacterium sp. TUM20984]
MHSIGLHLLTTGPTLPFDDEDSLAPLCELAGGDQPGPARPDNDDVSVHGANAID